MKAKQISQILTDLVAEQNQRSHISFFQIVTALGDRAFGLVILFFALPSALPFSAIPGVSLVFSLPILLIALQMVFGWSNLWLPFRLGNQQIKFAQLQLIVTKALPYLRWLEKLLQPRWAFFFSPVMEIITALVIVLLSIMLMTPVPFTNFLFASAIILLSLGLIEKDGLFTVMGFCLFIIYGGTFYTLIKSFL